MSTETHEPYISVTHGMRGYFAVMLTWTEIKRNDDGKVIGFYEPECTSPLAFNTHKEAMRDAEAWAEAEDLECK